MASFSVHLYWALCLLSCIGLGVASVELVTSFGPLNGIKVKFISYLGVPYAIVNEDDPFGPASHHPPFKTTLEAYNKTICPHIIKGSILGNIQCLTLNIYTHLDMKPGVKYDVMVHIHDEESHKPQNWFYNMVEKEIILVEINYRIGPFGFLCIPGTEYTNQGLKDQEVALKWVKKHIESFGGDRERITVIGSGAGAAFIDYHLLYNNKDNSL